MRVLHVTPFYPPAPARGGMARAAEALCLALAGLGHDVTVFTAGSGANGGEERCNGVRVRRFTGPRWTAERLVPFARGIAAAIASDRGGFDVAHLHGHRSGIVCQAAAALRRAGVGWVLQPHGTFPHHGQRRWAKAVWDAAGGMDAVTGARALLALSDAEARDLPAGPPSFVVGSGVERIVRAAAAEGGRRPVGGMGGSEAPRLIADVPPHLDKAAAAEEKFAAAAAEEKVAAPAEGRRRSPAPARLVFVGSDAPQKRASALVPLLRDLPDARLDLVGPVAPRFVDGFGACAARVTRHGPLDDDALAAILESADLLVHPAVGEAFGLAPFEACLAGAAAVVASGHGCGEWFARAGGCVVPPDDPARLLLAVRERLADRTLRSAEATAVAEFARRELTWPQAAARVAAVYDAVAGRPVATAGVRAE